MALVLLCCCNATPSVKAHDREFTKEELAELGVNMDYIFIFSDTSATYNGKPFQMGMAIGELCDIFGRYDRMPSTGIFVWDSIGVTMTTLEDEMSETNKVNGLLIDWNIDLRILGREDPELRERCPRKYFTGNIIVGGAALGRGMQIKDFLERTSIDIRQKEFFRLLYTGHLNDWDYRKTELVRMDYFTYRIRESDNQDNIESFNMAISSRSEIYKRGFAPLYCTTYHKDYPERFDHKEYAY